MEAGEPDYEDTPVASMPLYVCPTCDGDGWLWVSRAAVIGDRIERVMKQETCRVCAPAGEVPTGRVNLATGPGARVRPWERARVPGVDDWGRPRS